MKRPFNYILHTSGIGYWSNEARAVAVTNIALAYEDDVGSFGELRVYFDTSTWDVNEHGLIYTDKGFIRDLRKALAEHDLAGVDVDYSEQGMQGRDYVSLDVGRDFIRSYYEADVKNSDEFAYYGA